MFEIAKEYYEQNGDLLPICSYTTDEGYHLGQWIVTQRINYRKKDSSMTPERIAKLESIGMSWLTLHDRFWDESYSIVKDCFNQFGSLDNLREYSVKGYTWTLLQRQKYRQNQLSEEQIHLLNDVGMVWEPEDTWQLKYEAASEYYKRYGNLDIPANYITESGISLGPWYRSVRNQYKDGTLSEERIKLLENIGIVWVSVQTRTWIRYYEAAKEYFGLHGNSDIPADYITDSGLKLGVWVSSQRYSYSKGKLPEEQIMLLERINFSWQRDDSKWNTGFCELEKYYSIYGNTNVPNGYITNDGFELGRWVTTQRYRLKQNKVSEKRKAKLDKLGFCWEPNEAAWFDGYTRAKAYFMQHGNINIPTTYRDIDGFKLGQWVANKKFLNKKGVLSSERVEQLEKLGVV